MKYTIQDVKDVKEGKCAIKNDGTLEELQKLLNLCFPKDAFRTEGKSKYYKMYNESKWQSSNYVSLPAQSVKDFIIEDEIKNSIKDNVIELLKEDLECVHMYLNDLGAPIQCKKGDKYSIVGRIKNYIQSLKTLTIENEFLKIKKQIMNKEQLLGRLLINGHINIDELNVLIDKDVKAEKCMGRSAVEQQRENTLEEMINKLTKSDVDEYINNKIISPGIINDWLDQLGIFEDKKSKLDRNTTTTKHTQCTTTEGPFDWLNGTKSLHVPIL